MDEKMAILWHQMGEGTKKKKKKRTMTISPKNKN